MESSNRTEPGEPPAQMPPLVLRQIGLEEPAREALKLLLDVQESRAQIWLFALVDLAAENAPSPVAVALTVGAGDATARLHAFAVRPGLPEARLSARLLSGVSDRLRASGVRRLLVDRPANPEHLQRLSVVGFRSDGDAARLELPL